MDVSILIATRDCADMLAQTLEHFARLESGDLRWEVVVADNGSTDRTPAVLAAAAKTLSLVAVSEPRPGKNVALNRALSVARGEIFIFTDDDIVPSPRWMTDLFAATRTWVDHSVFCGPVVLRLPPDTPPSIRDYLDQSGPSHRGMFARFCPEFPEGPLNKGERPMGPNFAVRSSAIEGMTYCESIGPQGKNYAMGSESEFLCRLLDNGNAAIFVPSASVEHVIREEQLSKRALMDRSFRAGRGSIRMMSIQGRLADMPSLFGAPRYLWRKLVVAGARYVVSMFRSRQERLATEAALFKIRGAFHELGELKINPGAKENSAAQSEQR